MISMVQLLVLERQEWSSGALCVGGGSRRCCCARSSLCFLLRLCDGTLDWCVCVCVCACVYVCMCGGWVCFSDNGMVWLLVGGFVACLFSMYASTSVRGRLLGAAPFKCAVIAAAPCCTHTRVCLLTRACALACFAVVVVPSCVCCLLLWMMLPQLFLQHRDSALFNLSLLTSDVWGLLAGTLLFDQHLGWKCVALAARLR